MSDDMKCPDCGQVMESQAYSGRFGRFTVVWYCECCEYYYDEDGNVVGDNSEAYSDDFELANMCHGGDLDE